MGKLEHTNKYRAFGPGEVGNANPDHKSHRKEIDPYYQKRADELYRLKTLFCLTDRDLSQLVRNEFGQGFGDHFLPAFLNRTYGAGFNLRPPTLQKINFLIALLKKREKEFAS
jgi:hypothetical protein